MTILINTTTSLLMALGLLLSTAAGNVFPMSVDGWEDDVAVQSATLEEDPVKFTFAKHFQNHMVLQRAPQKANIYGFSPDIGAKIVMMVKDVANGSVIYHETVTKQGPRPGLAEWMITLDPTDTGTTVSIRVESERGVLQLHDVIFGDVWICSGQSNMQFTVGMMLRAEEELKEAHKYPNIRVFTAALKSSPKPQVDLLGVEEKWSKPSKSSLGSKTWTYFSAVCWLYGKNIHKALGIPIGLVATSYGGTPVEAWSSGDALAKCNITEDKNFARPHQLWPNVQPENQNNLGRLAPHNNSVLWNAMIVPFLPMTIYGVVWYQGESNHFYPWLEGYACKFPSMIDDWRVKFHKASGQQTRSNFPFGFVQLASEFPDPTTEFGFPDIRWHQTANYGYVPNPRMQNVFMAVAMDITGFNSKYGAVHPQDKTDVGDRLSRSGLLYAYGQPVSCQGPFPDSAVIKGAELIITYNYVEKLDIRDWTGFDLLCAPKSGGPDTSTVWRPTSIIANSTTTVSLYLDICSADQEVRGVRYAWRESPCHFKKCAVYDASTGLPGPQFVAYIQRDTNGHAKIDFRGPTSTKIL